MWYLVIWEGRAEVSDGNNWVQKQCIMGVTRA